MKLNRKYFLLALSVLTLLSCKDADNIENEIAKTPVQLRVSRFDRALARSGPEDILKLKSDYPYLFPEQYPDSLWKVKITDTIQRELLAEVDKAFGDFANEKVALEVLFKHIKYYFSDFDVPKVITVTSDVQYDTRVILADTLLILGLDNYLGKDHHFYRSIQRYIAQGLDKKYLTSDVVSSFAKRVNRFPRNRTFLSRMVHYGKELYLKDKLLPEISDAQKITYTKEQLAWSTSNEAQIWRYFIERELLYSTDPKLDRRFLDPAPFSKFRLELDRESPGRIGRYIGWQIVRAFMAKNPKTSLQLLLDMEAGEIFKRSNYKPQK
ncbi:MAG: gliding motility lipoprotein GldB [Bacteroidota bacterium]